jgi:UDP-N-acetyl-2-amino-2-deoxyglucuronate dehydrogenase
MTDTKPRFHIIGAAGYIAKKHLDAIKHVGGELITAVDLSDSVGILDSYNRDCVFATDYKKVYKHWQNGDYVIICAPNNFHNYYISKALWADCNVICEKPLVVNRVQLSSIIAAEKLSSGTVYPVLQMRYHPIVDWLKLFNNRDKGRTRGAIDYATPRGSWYKASWKGEPVKSGGLELNIGIHLFDLLTWIFGPVRAIAGNNQGDWNSKNGRLRFDAADVQWIITLDPKDAPDGPCRTFTFEGETRSIEGINLHDKVYEEILAGRGYRIEDARAGLELVWSVQKAHAFRA